MIGTILIVIGVGIICLAIGLFIGKMLSSPSDDDNTFVQKFKARMAEKKAEKDYRKQLEMQARAQALKELQPAMVAKLKEQELKKMTGEDKREKMQKFADAFSMGGQGGLGSDAKINQILGKEPQQQAPPQYQQQPQQYPPSQQYQQPYPVNQQYQQPQQQAPPQQSPQQNPVDYLGMGNSGNAFGDDKINQMLGKKPAPSKRGRKPKTQSQSEEDRILNFLK
jgi:hypothetical protein